MTQARKIIQTFSLNNTKSLPNFQLSFFKNKKML